MVTTLNLRDHLGRLLTNVTPGTSNATDQLGRAVVTGDLDFVGRDLISTLWAVSTAYALGDYVDLSTGELLVCVAAGTSHATTEPTAPAYGATVVDATATWRRVF
jgi:hypothetical protein